MPKHLADHLALGRHIPGVFTVNTDRGIGQIVEELIIIAGTSLENEYQDQIEYLPII